VKLKHFTENWNRMKVENYWSRIAIIALSGALLMMAYLMLNQKVPVVVMPPELSEQGEIIEDQATQSFHEAWSHHVARTIGNVSPGNADFVRASIEPLLAPSIYDQTLVVIERQLDEIERDQVAYTFEPREVIYDDKTKRTYVTGLHFLHQGTDQTQRFNRTYELEWRFEDYRPLLQHIETYQGGPRFPENTLRQGGSQ